MNATITSERPILFSGPMVRAIMEGRKTQTRRVVKWPANVLADAVDRVLPAPYYGHGARGAFVPVDKGGGIATKPFAAHHVDCPYGVPGDRLWVREMWAKSSCNRGQGVIRYAADDSARFVLAEDGGEGDWCGLAGVADSSRCQPVDRWRPSIHMPRWACRLVLEVVNRRVERVQAISEADAIADGCFPVDRLYQPPNSKNDYARVQFAFLWDSINGEGSWAENPWVWVVEFKRVGAS